MNKTETNSQKIKEDGFMIFFKLGNDGYASGIYRGKKKLSRKARKKPFTRA